MDVKTILLDLIAYRGDLQEFLNRRFKSSDKIVLPYNKVDFIVTRIGVFRLNNPELLGELETVEEYDYSDLRTSDVVLDIGGYIGGFSFKVAPRVKKVYVVEPLFVSELKENIEANRRFLGVDNIVLLPFALGENLRSVEYRDLSTNKFSEYRLGELIKLCGGRVDFVKCDCEGGEWSITPDDLRGVRRLEIEVHVWNGERSFEEFVDMLQKAGFDSYTSHDHGTHILVHARRRDDA